MDRVKYRWSIRRKLFAILMVILVLNVALLVLLGSRLFEAFYIHNKVSELKSAARSIEKTYVANPADNTALYELIDHIENRNSVIALLSLDGEGKVEMEYFTRLRQWEDVRDNRGDRHVRFEPLPPWPFENGLAGELAGLGDEMVMHEPDGGGGDHISLIKRLDDNLFLYIETPRAYLKSTADLAVRYTAYLSAALLLAAAVGLYLISGRVTNPIRRIQDVADKISRMDFSESCPVHSNDELGALSQSINNMSHELQSNIDKLIAANEVLQSDLERQQKTDRMRRQFIANVSHDFKTPLTLIISYAEALGGARDTAEADEYRSIIIEEGNRLSQMVGSLLELSQLESGAMRIKPSIFCVGEVIDHVVAAHRILAGQKELHTVREAGEEYIVEADYQRILQAAANLYDNAVKYAPSGGTVRIRAEQQDGKCVVSVFNTSPPIPPGEMENLFISFYRADRSRHRDGKSYGLGLAIVKGIMDMHGEACGCENVEDGVRFWFTLRLAQLEDDILTN